MSDILQKLDAAIANPPTTVDDLIAILSEAKAEIIARRAKNNDLTKQAEAAGAASTNVPSLAEIRKMVREEIGTDPVDSNSEEKSRG